MLAICLLNFINVYHHISSVLNRVGRVGLVGYSRGLFSWVKLVGHSRGSFSWVRLVGQTHGLFSWVILVGQIRGLFSFAILGHSLPLVILVPRATGYSEIPKLPDNFG